jgi:hypothetical protein
VFRPPYIKYWPDHDLVKQKYVAKTMYYLLYIDVALWLNEPLYRIINNTTECFLSKLKCVSFDRIYVHSVVMSGGGERRGLF